MITIKVLVEGYASEKEKKASSSAVLIKNGNIMIVVDPGMDHPKLVEGLEKLNLKPQDIHYVIQSHGHIDHSGLVGIFENATLIDNLDLYTFTGGFSSHNGKVPGTDIEIIKTPGHDPSHCSVMVKTNEGTVIVAADVFWWWDEEEQKTDPESLLNRKDPYVKDEKALLQSRRKILALADYIIPGHGKMFKVEK